MFASVTIGWRVDGLYFRLFDQLLIYLQQASDLLLHGLEAAHHFEESYNVNLGFETIARLRKKSFFSAQLEKSASEHLFEDSLVTTWM